MTSSPRPAPNLTRLTPPLGSCFTEVCIVRPWPARLTSHPRAFNVSGAPRLGYGQTHILGYNPINRLACANRVIKKIPRSDARLGIQKKFKCGDVLLSHTLSSAVPSPRPGLSFRVRKGTGRLTWAMTTAKPIQRPTGRTGGRQRNQPRFRSWRSGNRTTDANKNASPVSSS